jgi:hypothetical protein
VSLVSFFALRGDILSVLEEVETKSRPVYTLAEYYPSPKVRQLGHGSNISDLGIAAGEQTALCAQYLITQSGLEIQSERIRRWDGSIVYVVNQSLNPDSVMLTAAGVWNKRIIIAGNIGSNSKSESSKVWMRKYRAAIKKRFTRINAFWVGPLALERFRDGWRLTIAEQSSREYDLNETNDHATATTRDEPLNESSPKVTSFIELVAELEETGRKRKLQ